MIVCAITGVISLSILIWNVIRATKFSTSLDSLAVIHVTFGAITGASWLGFLIGLVTFLIDYAKS